MIEKLEIDTTRWPEWGYYLGIDYVTHQMCKNIKDGSGNTLDCTGWLVIKDGLGPRHLGRFWFLHGVRVSPLEVFETLTDDEKAEAAWELDEWK